MTAETKKHTSPKAAVVFDSSGRQLLRTRTLRAALAFAADYAQPCTVRTPAGRVLSLNERQGY